MRLLFVVILLLVHLKVSGQHFQFSQYNYTDLRVNPALVSSSDFAQVDLIYRNQKVADNAKLKSTYLSARYPLMSTKGRWSGIGVSFLDDRSGIGGLYQTNQLGLAYAITLPFSDYDFVSFGAQGIFQRQRLAIGELSTGSQFVPGRGFDQNVGRGEVFNDFNSNYFTFSTGLYWQRNSRKGEKLADFGISIFDINNPDESFFTTPSKLSSTFTANGSFRVAKHLGWSYYPEVLLNTGGGNTILNVGFLLSYDLSEHANFYQSEGKVNIVAKYVTGGYCIAGVQFETPNLSVGFSYDIPVTDQIANNGALEFGITLRKLVPAKQRVKKRYEKDGEIDKQQVRKVVSKKKPKPETEEESKISDNNASENQSTDSLTNESVSDETNDEKDVDGTGQVGDMDHLPFNPEEVAVSFNFEFNQTTLKSSDKSYLNELIKVLEENQHLNVDIIGHTDNVGSTTFNEALSKQRALTVKQFLLSKGISQSRIKIVGKGESEPLADNQTAEGRAKNRRVEFILSYQSNNKKD